MKIKVKFALPILILFHILIWLITFNVLAVNDVYSLYRSFFGFMIEHQGEFYSTLLMLMLAFNILLAARLRFFENIFSGLDKVYVVHKYTGYFVIFLLILHDVFITGFSNPTGFFYFSLKVATPLLYVFLFSIFISALPNIPYLNKILNIPYHIWKYTHYIMGFLFLIGIYHSLGVSSFTFSNRILSVYMYVVYIVGSIAFIYKTFLYNILKKKYEYYVSNLNYFENPKILEISLENRDNKYIKYRSGEFAFFKFEIKGLQEVHPFTISNFKDKDKKIRLSIKCVGDWSFKLKENIKIGTKVFVDGPYGNFTSNKSLDNMEIWIAGGIGITPFLAMLQDYKRQNNINKKIIFIWNVKIDPEAIYKNEILENLPENIEFTLLDISKGGFFTFGRILPRIKSNLKSNYIKTGVSVFICGSKSMRESIIKEAKKTGISYFRFEEFRFR